MVTPNYPDTDPTIVNILEIYKFSIEKEYLWENY